jgi:hypothetical protein
MEAVFATLAQQSDDAQAMHWVDEDDTEAPPYWLAPR